jgi:hypothetical protein
MSDATAQAKLELLRDHVREELGAAVLQGQLAQTHLQIADDDAMTYALRRLVRHVREAARTANEIIALGAGDGRPG